jgi:hypothetical protein
VNPNYDAIIECLPGCQDAGNPALYPPVKAGEHRVQKILTATGNSMAAAILWKRVEKAGRIFNWGTCDL